MIELLWNCAPNSATLYNPIDAFTVALLSTIRHVCLRFMARNYNVNNFQFPALVLKTAIIPVSRTTNNYWFFTVRTNYLCSSPFRHFLNQKIRTEWSNYYFISEKNNV